MKDQIQFEILNKLIDHVKPRGSVWCSGWLPSYRMEFTGDPIVLTWEEAARLVGIEYEL